MTRPAALACVGLLVGAAGCASHRTESAAGPASDSAACHTLRPAAAGGPAPAAGTVVLRWLGTANYELSYAATSSCSTPSSTADRGTVPSAWPWTRSPGPT